MNDVALDPIVADLAAALVPSGKEVALPDDAVQRARGRFRAAAPSEKLRLARDIVAWCLKLERIGGRQTQTVRGLAAELALDLLGDEEAARDMFGAAGLATDFAAAMGARAEVRAPRVEPTRAPAFSPKPVRGLRK